MNGHIEGAAAGAVILLAAAPYLARVTLSATQPDGRLRGRPASSARTVGVAVSGTALGALFGYGAGWSWALASFVVAAGGGLVLLVVDLDQRRMPNWLVGWTATIGWALLAAAALIGGDSARLTRASLAALVLLVAFMALSQLTPGFGAGDGKVFGLVGLYLGWVGWGAVFTGVLLAYVAMLIGMLARRGPKRGTSAAFGPAILFGTGVAVALAAATT